MTWNIPPSDAEFFLTDDPGVRGTGRTTRLLTKIPAGSTYITLNNRIAMYTMDFARTVLDRHDLAIISFWQARNWLLGRKTSVAIDHCCFYDVVREPELFSILDYQKEIYYNGANNDIIRQRRDPQSGQWVLHEIAGA